MMLADAEGLVIGLVIGVIVWISVGAGVGHWIGEQRGRGGAGAAMGLFFGPIGWIVVALLPRSVRNEAVRQLAVEEERKRIITEGVKGEKSWFEKAYLP